jgi:hypothetical protein
MRKNYGNHYPTSGCFTGAAPDRHVVKADLIDVDARLDRLERLFRAHVLDPAEVPIGTSVAQACDKVEKVAKQVKALAEEVEPRIAYNSMPITKAGLRKEVLSLTQEIDDLRDANARLAEQVRVISKDSKDMEDLYWKNRLETTQEKEMWRTKLRQFVKETVGKL